MMSQFPPLRLEMAALEGTTVQTASSPDLLLHSSPCSTVGIGATPAYDLASESP